MFLSANLHVYVLVVVFMQRRHGAFIPEPEIDRIGRLLERGAGPGYFRRDVLEEGLVFEAKVVVFWKKNPVSFEEVLLGPTRTWPARQGLLVNDGRLTSLRIFNVSSTALARSRVHLLRACPWSRSRKIRRFIGLDVIEEDAEILVLFVRLDEEKASGFVLDEGVCVSIARNKASISSVCM